jgi:hypothetical protein
MYFVPSFCGTLLPARFAQCAGHSLDALRLPACLLPLDADFPADALNINGMAQDTTNICQHMQIDLLKGALYHLLPHMCKRVPVSARDFTI